MKKSILLLASLILVMQSVLAIDNVRILEGEQEVEYIKTSGDINPKTVSISFIADSFDRGFVDASTLSFNSQESTEQSNVIIDPNQYCTGGARLSCNIPGIILRTSESEVNIGFKLFVGNDANTETVSINFQEDNAPPNIQKIEINGCGEDCYVGNAPVTAEVFLTDDSGFVPSGVPLKIADRNAPAIPISCSEGSCTYNIGLVECAEGSEVSFRLEGGSNGVKDVLGNERRGTKQTIAICDNTAPQIQDLRITPEGALTHLVDGAPILLRAEVIDSTQPKITLDLTNLDGGILPSQECQETTTNFQWLCEVSAHSPAGYQVNDAIITIEDKAGNIKQQNYELEVLKLNNADAPEVSINNVQHRGSITRMFMEAASLRTGFAPNYPISFNLNPTVEVNSTRLQSSIAFIDLVDCQGGIITQDYALGSQTAKKNRIDVSINTQYTESPAKINCSVDVYVKSGDTYFNTPARADIVANVNLRNAGVSAPGERVVQKIEGSRQTMTNRFALIESVNNKADDLRKLCAISDALDNGQIISAGIAGIGYATQFFDGGATKTAGQLSSENLLGISGAVGTYLDDKSNREGVANKLSGFLKKACTMVQCTATSEDLQLFGAEGISSTGTEGWGELGRNSLEQLSAPTPKDNFLAAWDQKCLPAAIANLNDFGQIYCGETRCLKTMAYNGLDMSSCEAIAAEGMCKKIVGSSFEMGGYLLSKNPGTEYFGKGALAIKNFRDRASTIAFNAALGAVEEELIESYTGECDRTSVQPATSDDRTWSCFIPFAVRLYIKQSEQEQFTRETFGMDSNLCQIARCEGNDCAAELPNLKTPGGYEELLVNAAPSHSAEDIQEARSITAEQIPAAQPFEYTKLGESNGRGYYIRNDIYSSIDEVRNLAILSDVANDDYIRGSTREWIIYDQTQETNDWLFSTGFTGSQEDWQEYVDTTIDDPETHAFDDGEFVQMTNPEAPEVEFFATNFLQESGNLNDKYVTLPDDVAPDELAPGHLVDPEYYGDGEFLVSDGETYVRNQDGEWDRVYDANNLGDNYRKYAQAAGPINRWFERNVVAGVKNEINGVVDGFDAYSKIENNFCAAAIHRDKEAAATIFEPTSTGIKEFMFNAEKQEFQDDEGTKYFYTLIWYMAGFDDRAGGYDFEILLKPGNKKIGDFSIQPNEVYRPDETNPDFKSLWAWNDTEEYNQLCFKFSPQIIGKDEELCKPLKDNAWSGLGDPYNPSNTIRGSRGLSGGASGGFLV